jgi:hypothetical protein
MIGRVARRASLCLACASALLHAQDVASVLRSDLQFAEADIVRLRAGEVIARVVPTPDRREILVAGAVALEGDFGRLVTRLHDVRTLLATTPNRRRLVTLSQTPAAEEFAAWALERDDVEELAQCRVGDCDSKLSADMIESVRALPWGTPEVTRRVEQSMRSWAARYVTAYRHHGRDSLIVYADRREPGVASSILATLHSAPPSLRERAPELSRHLLDYPRGSWTGTNDLMVWAVDRLPGARTTFTLRHAASWQDPERRFAVVAEQLLYANHYLDGELGVVALVVDAESSIPWLVIVRRFHFDNLPGGPLNIRGKVRDRTLAALRSELAARRTQFAR